MSRLPKLSLYRFRLYVADSAPNSLQAAANLNALCRTYLAGRHEIEIIDVFAKPQLAMSDAIFMTPTLLRLSPGPQLRIVGTLAQTDIVLQALGLDTVPA